MRIVLSAMLTLLLVAAPGSAQEVTGEEVRVAIERAKARLWAAQRANGRWDDYSHSGGTTALAALALLNAGVPADHPRLRPAIEAVRNQSLEHTYVVSLKAQVLAVADPVRFREPLQQAANWLTQAQQANGMWSYTVQGGRTDFSNSQFALLGLHEAAKAGARVHNNVWIRARLSWVNSQNSDGGWGYIPGFPKSTGSMTTAGIASLYICGNALAMNRTRGKVVDGNVVCCTPYVEYRPVARALQWLARNFSAHRNPGGGGWYYYYMYGVERVGILSGLRHFGDRDWYREGAAELLDRGRHGTWREVNEVVDTAFTLLFLAKGHRPVLFNKLQYSADANIWNITRNDLPHLLASIGDQLGEPMSWEAVPLNASLEDWLTAPILYFNGTEFPRFGPAHLEQFREFVQQGGTILIGATCYLGPFRTAFEKFAAEAFPDDPVIQLPDDHPVYQLVHDLRGSKLPLYGIGTGCRTSVIFSPKDIACLWDLGNVPGQSEEAFKLGTNIAAYATGLEPLPDKLDAVRLVDTGRKDAPAVPARGAVHIGQLMHNGDWRPNAKAVPNLAEYLNTQLAVDVIPAFEPLTATDPRLSQHPIVYMTGHYTFELEPDEVEALRLHLQRGGFLLANACCGRQAFDTAFRTLARQLFPDQPLERLPADHPIIAGRPGVPLPAIAYRQALRIEYPAMSDVQLEGVTLDGRLAVVYSRFSLDCGMDGHKCFACRGIEHEDALRVAGNVLLHALSY